MKINVSVLSGVDHKKQLACVHSSLIIANNFAPVSEALGLFWGSGLSVDLGVS